MTSLTLNSNIMKTKSVKAINGTINFTDVEIIGNPGSDVFIKLEADTIDKLKIKKVY